MRLTKLMKQAIELMKRSLDEFVIKTVRYNINFVSDVGVRARSLLPVRAAGAPVCARLTHGAGVAVRALQHQLRSRRHGQATELQQSCNLHPRCNINFVRDVMDKQQSYNRAATGTRAATSTSFAMLKFVRNLRSWQWTPRSTPSPACSASSTLRQMPFASQRTSYTP